ncbi:unnamed protein product [Parajaminaea phylloscopi]
MDSVSDTTSAPPGFLQALLSDTPLLSCPHPHKPAHPELTSRIADLALHPALEAALHLANGDLYSAHFLVRKAQGGAKELDWGHAILHRLEGDWGNAKCWYTDLDNVGNSSIYNNFWRDGSAHGLTACQFVDLSALYSPTSPTPEEVHQTSAKHDKIKTAFSLEELTEFRAEDRAPLSKEETSTLAGREIQAMISGLADEYGWRRYTQSDSVEALASQSKGEDGERVEHDAQGMVLGGGTRRW